MSKPLESAISATVTRIVDFIKLHREQPEVSFANHVQRRRKERASAASSKQLIYLDTNAWKCMVDCRLEKPNLTPAMLGFGEALEQAARNDLFIFPIGLPTFFELDSMTHPSTRDTMTELVDELSHGFCITSFQERVGHELRQVRTSEFNNSEGLEDFLCSSMELLGITAESPPDFVRAHLCDEETFKKAFFDSLSELPFSVLLEVAKTAPGPRWDNSRGISLLNEGKKDHQSDVPNLNTGIFLELKGCVESWFTSQRLELSPEDIARYSLEALYHWNKTPATKAMPTLRVLSALYGLMRFDPQRRYKDGDPNDFMVAASALPVAHALFTDRKLASLVSDPRIGIKQFSDCEVVSGFEAMADYLVHRF